jgi:beta-glucosidase-like glycosyl hydrolase/CubicO group peptidase (beta-lactamase class C family)
VNLFSALLLILTLAFVGPDPIRRFNLSESTDKQEASWVDSLYNALPDTLRIAQLMSLRASDEKNPKFEKEIDSLVRRYQVGGICLFQGNPEMLGALINRCQNNSRIPLMVSIDGEWGLGMRLKNTTIAYPRQLMLGAIQDNNHLRTLGKEVGNQCKRLGIHVNFAPVADINNNAENPVINDRSFGEDRENVTAKCLEYMYGMQEAGIMACAKHFPGHGDTNTDSHFDLPLITHPLQRLDSLELYPFKTLSANGIGSLMVAHLQVPALESRPNTPTTLSRNTIHELARKKLNFEGLIFTDAMEMQALRKYYPGGGAELEALKAGIDVVLLPGNVGSAILSVKNGLDKGEYDRSEFEKSVKRVLRAKYRLGLNQPQRVRMSRLREDLNAPGGLLLKRTLTEQALTLIRDNTGIVGLPHIDQYRIATLSLGEPNQTAFQETCNLYAPMQHFHAPKNIDTTLKNAILQQLKPFNVVLVGVHNMRSRAADDYGLLADEIVLLRALARQCTLAVTVFGNPYALRYFNDVPTLLQAYNEDPLTQSVAAQALFGAIDIQGKLPVTASKSIIYGQGITKRFPEKRLAYNLPAAAGFNADTLARMDEIVQEMIRSGAAPGCQILVAKNNIIVWNKAYGFHTYDTSRPVKISDLYDLASVTKVAATTVSAMKLADEKKIDLDAPIGKYIPQTTSTNKGKLTLRTILAHHAQLQPWIPFYQKTLVNKHPSPHLYHRISDADSEVPVSPGLFLDNNYLDTIWNTLFTSELRNDRGYKYSDLGLYLTARVIENLTRSTLDQYAKTQFYQPLGMRSTFNPWKTGLTDQCPPTEEDRYFRQQRIQGYVHDMGAAMLGGVSGHAGLFSNANDIAKLFQMLLNGGSYAGKQYLDPQTVNEWTIRYEHSTRRGIGFDMKDINPAATPNMDARAGANTFGHTGFTGICVWADPDKDLIFIFCSNRTYPTMENNKLIDGNYRPRIQNIIYRALTN